MRDLRELDKYRLPEQELQFTGELGGAGEGFFAFYSIYSRKEELIRAIAGSGMGWDHVSVSLGHRCPTWDEMEYTKRLFFQPYEICMQLHVAEKDHISHNPYTLHIWRPQTWVIQLPPNWMVGPPNDN